MRHIIHPTKAKIEMNVHSGLEMQRASGVCRDVYVPWALVTDPDGRLVCGYLTGLMHTSQCESLDAAKAHLRTLDVGSRVFCWSLAMGHNCSAVALQDPLRWPGVSGADIAARRNERLSFLGTAMFICAVTLAICAAHVWTKRDAQGRLGPEHMEGSVRGNGGRDKAISSGVKRKWHIFKAAVVAEVVELQRGRSVLSSYQPVPTSEIAASTNGVAGKASVVDATVGVAVVTAI